MPFLKALFWSIFGFVIGVFLWANRKEVVEIQLWADYKADVKFYGLVVLVFLLGFLPTMLYYRARIWSLKRRLDTQNPSNAGPTATPQPVPAPVRRSSSPTDTPLAERDAPDREATDSKAWPSA